MLDLKINQPVNRIVKVKPITSKSMFLVNKISRIK